MKKVEALIIGAGRSGTTTLYEYLDSHPQVCFSSVKELHYFSFDDLYARGEDYYHHFIKHQKPEQRIVSSSTYLLIDHKAIPKIKAYNPDMKIIVMLRDPVARAYSGYQYALNNGYEKQTVSFAEHIDNEINVLKNGDIIEQNNLCNLYQSRYYEHLKEWLKYFPKENFLLLKSTDLFKNKTTVFKQLSDFLQTDAGLFPNEDIRSNQAAAAKFKGLQQVLVNRNHPVTRFLRKLLPAGLRYKIIHSGITEKVSKLNRKDAKYTEISEAEKQYAADLLKTDTENLYREFGIRF